MSDIMRNESHNEILVTISRKTTLMVAFLLIFMGF